MIPRAMLAVAYATGRASHARQVKGDDADKKGYPGPPGWGFSVRLTTPHSKKKYCYETSRGGQGQPRAVELTMMMMMMNIKMLHVCKKFNTLFSSLLVLVFTKSFSGHGRGEIIGYIHYGGPQCLHTMITFMKNFQNSSLCSIIGYMLG
jgi:hypothetical protein